MAPLILLLMAVPSRGPYLMSATPNSIVVVWRTAEETDAIVRFGSSPENLDRMVALTETSTQHEVHLEGLEPSTRYYYAVENGAGRLAGGDLEHYFVTSPPIGSRGPFRFWVVGDSGTGTAKQGRVRDAMLLAAGRHRPDLYLHVGDIAYSDGTDEEFQKKFFQMYPNVLRNTPIWPSMGNHEAGSANSLTETGPYYHGYVLPKLGEAGGLASGSEAYYSFDYANVHFTVLESHQNELREEGSAMLAWLEMDLAATDQEWLVVYFHHPPYTKGSHDSDFEIAHIEIRERALPIMEAAGVDLVLGGHSHIYERSYPTYGAYDTPTTADGVIMDQADGRTAPYHKLGTGMQDATMFVVAGHGGTNVSVGAGGDHPLMYFSEVRNGSVLVDVKGSTLMLRNVRIDGVISDSFSLVKNRGLRLIAPEPGSLLAVGSTVAIDWISAGSSNQIELSYSQDGSTWTPIATGEGGRYVWTPTEALGPVKLRATDLGDPSLADELDGTVDVKAKAPLRVIPFESIWRYSFEDQIGVDWTSVLHRDARWAEGKAKIGVCGCLPWDCGCETYVAEALTTPTLYLRKKISVEEIPSSLRLRAIHETGMLVFVNGVEIFRRHIGEQEFDRPATAAITYAETVDEMIDLPEPNPFVAGENVVAVLMKKAPDSASLSFDLEMTLLFEPPPPVMTDEGCACSTAGGSSASVILLLVLAWARRGAGRGGAGRGRRRE